LTENHRKVYNTFVYMRRAEERQVH